VFTGVPFGSLEKVSGHANRQLGLLHNPPPAVQSTTGVYGSQISCQLPAKNRHKQAGGSWNVCWVVALSALVKE
jgi:hypothetical protein